MELANSLIQKYNKLLTNHQLILNYDSKQLSIYIYSINKNNEPLTGFYIDPKIMKKLKPKKLYQYLDHKIYKLCNQINVPYCMECAITYSIPLTGQQMIPPVETTAAGRAVLVLSPNRQSLSYNAIINNLDTPQTTAHFHQAPIGQNGPIVKGLTMRFLVENIYTANWKLVGNWTSSDGTEPLTSELVQALLRGYLYLMIHSCQNPQGELRGQIVNTPILSNQ